MEWIHLAQDIIQFRAFETRKEAFGFHESLEIS
jgi:hypothetical protein